MNKIFIDSNICVYAFEKKDTKKFQISFNLLGSSPLISSQVIIETYNACFKKLKLSKETCEENTLILCDITDIVPITDTVIKQAVLFKNKYNFSFLDACIVATAYQSNCSILYSEDLQHDQIIEGSLKIINPFF